MRRQSLAAALQPAAENLEHQLAYLRKFHGEGMKPENQPLPESIQHPNVAPSLRSAARALEKHQRRNSLSEKFAARPTRDDLIDSRIMRHSIKLAHALHAPG